MTRYVWDERKDLLNQRKHDTAFSQAIIVFQDPFAVTSSDRVVEGEQRWHTIGMRLDVLLLVVHTVEEEDEGDEVIRLISARTATPKETKPMKPKIVSYTFENLPPVSEEQEARLRARAARPPSEIDTTDIPELSEEQWKKAVRGRFYRPAKRQVRATIDTDVLAWLKSQGRGYHARLNDILRREMLKSLQSSEQDSQQEHTAA